MKNLTHNSYPEGATTKIKFYSSNDKKIRAGSLITDLKTFKIKSDDGLIVFEEHLTKSQSLVG